jgi:hydroxymethylpyrimidine pyrophosphatase-like HAD family hydrolase
MVTPESGPDREFSHEALAFDGGEYTIPYLATSPDGFTVHTRHQLRRVDAPVSEVLNGEELERFKKGMQGEVKFQATRLSGLHDARTALTKAREAGASTSELSELEDQVETARQKFISGMAGKVGIRDIEVHGNDVSVNVKEVSFPAYQEFSRPQDRVEVLDLSSVTGAAMVVRTTDGRLVIQHRGDIKQRLDSGSLSRGNKVYGGIPGASVAGMVDATIESPDRVPGTPDPVDTDFVRAAILKEAGEELGVELHDFSKLRIVGLAHDNLKVHDEFLLLTDARITAEQLNERSRVSKRNKELGDADFEEKFIDIEASPRAIETLLTQVKCPLPPTHSAALVAGGYSMMVQGQGPEAANEWKQRVQEGVRENYREINEIVARYYEEHPEALEQIPERFWKAPNVPPRNPHGYSSLYSPEEQGLPSFEDEMRRTELAPDTRRHVENAYLFDVDGPLTDPNERRVTEPELLTIVAEKLKSGEPVGLNTGRSAEWVMKRFLEPLRSELDDPADLENFIVIGEKGGTWVTFDKDGEAEPGQSGQLEVPDDVRQSVLDLIEQNPEYREVMTVDNRRDTMLSIIMNKGVDIDEFDLRRATLGEEIRQILEANDVDDTFAVDYTTIAIDIENRHVGKDVGSERFLEFLRVREVRPEHFVAFGDSVSDIEMADELERKGQDVTFVYVGQGDVTNGDSRKYEIVQEPGFSSGTLRYLKNLS